MCGITGIWNWNNNNINSNDLYNMACSMKHRGPDGLGFAIWHDEKKNNVVYKYKNEQKISFDNSRIRLGLAHNWLAIQDQSQNAQQPMCSKNGRYWIVFNGEIYNFHELRSELKKGGCEFTTSSDTEVIIALWERLSFKSIEKLNGMFAFLLYDVNEQCLWAVRDRFGIKPLYYSVQPGKNGIIFASEYRAFFASGLVRKNWSTEALISFLAAAVNKPDDIKTFFKDIYELPAGCYLKIKKNDIKLVQYYNLAGQKKFDKDENDLPEFKNLFLNTINKHLLSVREVGTCMSGGLDSTNIVYAIKEALQDDIINFKSFTIGSSNSLDYRYSRIAAEKINIKNYAFQPSSEILLNDLVELVLACEIPNHTWGHINQFLLLKYINQHFGLHVLLDGQGGDEVFSGYPWFFPFIKRYYSNKNSDIFMQINDLYYNKLPLPKEVLEFSEKIYSSKITWISAFEQGALKAMDLEIDDLLNLSPIGYYLNNEIDWQDFKRRVIYRRELHHLLRQEDRIGMWFEIESRVPFLDHNIVEFVARFNPLFLLKDGYLKYPLRVMFPEIPEVIRFNHIKKGFWEPHFNFPDIRDKIINLIGKSKILSHYIKDRNEIKNMSNLTLWRFFQIIILDEVNSKTDIKYWIDENFNN